MGWNEYDQAIMAWFTSLRDDWRCKCFCEIYIGWQDEIIQIQFGWVAPIPSQITEVTNA